VKKLIIQLPCFNEEGTLAIALQALPRQLAGVECVEWLIVNDGSSDRTVEVARANGVDHIVDLGTHQGLARGFLAGLDAGLRAGADIIVNTDADNQYDASDIPKLIEPILRGEADVVVGARPIAEIEHFSPLKKALQKLGSWAVRVASGTDVADAPSGFRAFSRRAAMQINVFSQYTYTLETIIQAGQKNIAIISVPIRTNGDLRPSRLVKSSAPTSAARSSPSCASSSPTNHSAFSPSRARSLSASGLCSACAGCGFSSSKKAPAPASRASSSSASSSGSSAWSPI